MQNSGWGLSRLVERGPHKSRSAFMDPDVRDITALQCSVGWVITQLNPAKPRSVPTYDVTPRFPPSTGVSNILLSDYFKVGSLIAKDEKV